MSHFKVMVRLGMDSANPLDAAVNTWHCDALNLPAGYTDFVDDLEVFYRAVDNQLAAAINPSDVVATVYDMSDPEPRAPVYTKTFTGLATSTDTDHPELAICLSFQGARISGTPQARRRGRVYLGPITAGARTSSTNPLIATSIIAQIATAAGALLVLSQASTEYKWVVYSPTDDAMVVVDNGWVDNAVDIQRRRGIAPTIRELFS